MDMFFEMNILDYALILITFLFLVRGIFRGFIDETAGLIAVIGGLWLAGRFYGELVPFLGNYIKDPSWAGIIAFGVIFCIVLLAMALLISLLNKLFELALANWMNPLLGGVVGAVKGVILCAIAVTLLQFFMPEAPYVATSKIRPHITTVSSSLMQLLPLGLFQS